MRQFCHFYCLLRTGETGQGSFSITIIIYFSITYDSLILPELFCIKLANVTATPHFILQGVDSLNGALIGNAVGADDDESMMDLALLGNVTHLITFIHYQGCFYVSASKDKLKAMDVSLKLCRFPYWAI